MIAYAELAVTTNFSFLRGGSHAEELVSRAAEIGLAAIGIADRNTLAGVVRAHVALRETQAKNSGLKLIVGARIVFEDGTPDILAYPEDRAAYGRLSQLLTLGKMRTRKGECHLTLDDLITHREGLLLIVMPGRRVDDRLRETIRRLKGKTLHLGATLLYRGDDRRRMDELATLAHENGVPLIALNDVLYHHPDRRPLQDVLTCIREHVTIGTAGRRLVANAERNLKPPAEMGRLFRNHPQAIVETIKFISKIKFSLDDLRYEYPDEPVPSGENPQSWLEKLTWMGAAERYPAGVPEKVQATILKEFALISQLNYALYFLTVHDIVQEARRLDILAQGRGSAANSSVCYCLGITAVNPAEADLLFERFISAERSEPPDIDVDFEHERREEIIQYIYRRYGRDKAGLCATVISYRPRSAIREVGKALGLTEDVTARLANTVWGSWGDMIKNGQIQEAGFDPSNPMIARAIQLATELQGFPRHLSQHVGGFILTRGRLDSTVPIGWAAMEDRSFIEWDKDDIDALGIMKVDVLALGMLTCIRKAFDLIREHKREDFTLDTIPKEDATTYRMIQRADTLGVFQIESRAQMNMLPRLKPATFYDLVIEVAIVRPGPIQGDMVHPYLRRRQGIDPVFFPSPSPEHGPPDELARVLGKTLGVPLFQEQAMRIAIEAAKFTPEEANRLRRAMATFRRVGTIHLFQQKMVEGMVRRGYDAEFAARCFRQIEGFGEYGFPESHAASFAKLVYVSCWLKCHHPDVFACALLNSQPMGFYAPAQIIRDAREHDVEVREADVNWSCWDNGLEGMTYENSSPSQNGEKSPEHRGGRMNGQGEFVQSGGQCAFTQPLTPTLSPQAERGSLKSLRLGFRQIDGFREDWALALVTVRNHAPFDSIERFARRTALPARALKLLAEADAFRSMGLDRRQALWAISRLPDDDPLPLFAARQADELGQEQAILLPDMRLSEHVVTDYQMTGMSLKGHPVMFLRPQLAREGLISCKALHRLKHNDPARTAGVILVRQKPGSAKGVVFMTIEDETGIANVVIWKTKVKEFRREVMGSRLIEIRGRVQKSPEGILHLVAEQLIDRSAELICLADDPVKAALARADEVARPVAEDRRTHTGNMSTRHTHPRDVRILPKSRDFH